MIYKYNDYRRLSIHAIKAMKTFDDIIVVPFEELLQRPRGSFHKGGPIWPDWQNPGIERHWHRHVTIDALPELPTDLALSTRDDLFWGGAVCRHFGHQIMDFSMRVIASRAADPNAGLLFACQKGQAPLPYFFGIMDWLEVPRDLIVILDQPTRFPRLRVMPQAERREQVGPSQAHLDLMDRFIAEKSLSSEPSRQPVYVSRAGQQIRFAGEEYLESLFREAGGLVIRPENHPLDYQMRTVLGSKHVIFAEGSAMHLTSLAGRNFEQIDVLLRRPNSQVGRAFMEPRAKSLTSNDISVGLIYSLKDGGQPYLTRGLPVLDGDRVNSYFAQRSFPNMPTWSNARYEDALKRDVSLWLTTELSPKRPMSQDGIESVKLTSSAILKKWPHIQSFALDLTNKLVAQR